MCTVCAITDHYYSGTHGLNNELGGHSTRNSSKAFFFFCEYECESVEHVL